MTLHIEEIFPPHGKPLATLFVFTTTAHEALHVDPLCRPAKLLKLFPVRLISVNLPLHNENLPSFDGVKRWADTIHQTQQDVLAPFFAELKDWIETHLSHEKSLGFLGISRGAFIAAHLARLLNRSIPLTLFAPMLRLDYPRLWPHGAPPDWVAHYRLENHTSFLQTCPIYLSMSNRDELVHTNEAVYLYQKLLDKKERHLSSHLHLYPPIGMYGHGTPDCIFQEGVHWLLQQLHIPVSVCQHP